MKLKTLEPIIIKILENSKTARQDDFFLYGKVLIEFGVPYKRNLFEFLLNAKKQGMPTFESVSRCRRHIQELRQDLKDSKTAIAREQEIDKYVEYNRTNLA